MPRVNAKTLHVIKRGSQSFKGSSFPNAKERRKAWNRFQSLIGHVKECQKKAKEAFQNKVDNLKEHLNAILSYARKATPSSALDDVILTIATGGLSAVIKVGIEAVLGPYDERKLEL